MPKVKKGYSLVQIYKYYLAQNKEEKFGISSRLYKDIVFLFNKKLSRYLLEGGEVRLPFGLAQFRIKKFAFGKYVPGLDYGTYRKTGKKLLHLNEHSDGFKAGWYWNKGNVSIQGKSAFSFKPSWTNMRELAKVMNVRGEHKRFME